MREDIKDRFRNRWEQKGNNSHVWTGIFILLIGVAALVKSTVTDLPDWLPGNRLAGTDTGGRRIPDKRVEPGA